MENITVFVKKREIVVDGKAIEHSIGDTTYYVYFGRDGWQKPTAKQNIYEPVTGIKVTEDGISYVTDEHEFQEPDNATGEFWTKEEAEDWIRANIPQEFMYHPNDELFIVVNSHVIPIHAPKADGLRIDNGRLCYEFRDTNYRTYLVNEDGFAVMRNLYQDKQLPVYKSYEDAKKTMKDERN